MADNDNKVNSVTADMARSPILIGRETLYTDETVITSDNVVSILNDCLDTFHHNQNDIKYLYNYYKGRQPILDRIKKVRPEINNKVVENHAWEIVSFKVAYLLGAPIAYTRRKLGGKSSEDAAQSPSTVDSESAKVGRLNEIMHMIDKEAVDHDIAEWNHICGTAYRYVRGNKSDEGIEIGSCDPRRTAVVYSRELDARPIMAFQETVRHDKPTLYTVWNDTVVFTIENNRVVEVRPHGTGAVPIIEYPLNNARIGSFEVVLTILDAINKLSSNRLDGTEQFIQSFLKFINCKLDKEKFEEFREQGAIYLSSDSAHPSDVGIIESELDQTQAQIEIDHLYQQALIICGMPDRNGTNRASGDSGQAVILRDGWTMAESTARDTIMQWERSEKVFLRIALSLLKTLDKLDLSLADIDIRFTKGNTENLLVKTQALSNLLNAGVHPEIAFAIPHLFDDPHQAYIDSRKYLAKWLPVLPEVPEQDKNTEPMLPSSGADGRSDGAASEA